MTEAIEPDRVEGAPHPRETARLFGHEAAEAAFLAAHASGRMHHAWLLTGPRGVGKATLAWRIARFLLAAPPSAEAGLFGAPEPARSLDIPEDHPVSRRLRALSEPRLKLVRRGWDEKKDEFKTQITVEEARGLKSFFQLSAADGGTRAVIVDAADDMNLSAANAVLKILEEPPPEAAILIVCHQPARLLPTIRSRCRELRLSHLPPEAMAQALAQAGVAAEAPERLAALAGGSVGEAVRLEKLGGVETYAALVGLFRPGLDRPAALSFAEGLSGRANEPRLDLVLRLIGLFLARLARAGLEGTGPEAAPGEAALFTRLSPGPEAARVWAALYDTLGARGRHGKAVNLDPAALVLDLLLKIEAEARRAAA